MSKPVQNQAVILINCPDQRGIISAATDFISENDGNVLDLDEHPYHSAHDRGVKIIGASRHYITEYLDAGPIIDQDVVRISHKNEISELVRKGKDLEKIVLLRAIYLHLQRKILVYQNRTIIFD